MLNIENHWPTSHLVWELKMHQVCLDAIDQKLSKVRDSTFSDEEFEEAVSASAELSWALSTWVEYRKELAQLQDEIERRTRTN